MTYKLRDHWHQAERQYLAEKSAMLPKRSITNYRSVLEMAGRLSQFSNPRSLTIQRMQSLEPMLGASETTRAWRAAITKDFLKWAGNKDAHKWKLSNRQRPKKNGIFLSENQVAIVRQFAHALGPDAELIFSLGVDDGLRWVDMSRLTMTNADELMRFKRSEILGKGRNGGKLGHLELSRMTEAPLGAYLKKREEMTKRLQQDDERLLVIEHQGRLHRLSYGRARLLMDSLSKLSDISFHLHDLRRTYGNRLHRAGIPIETIAKLMRHESIDQAFRSYIGIDSDEMRAAQDKLCPKD